MGRLCPCAQTASQRKGGARHRDPDYELSVEWRAVIDRIKPPRRANRMGQTRSRQLIVHASSRNGYNCPGERSKSFRLCEPGQEVLVREECEVDFLDLLRQNSEHDLHIHPCKWRVLTAMSLCRWPSSCYPNHSFIR